MSKQPTYTDQQAAAINTRDVSIALSAGAGCGKTFVLTQRFLKLIEPGAPPRPTQPYRRDYVYGTCRPGNAGPDS